MAEAFLALTGTAKTLTENKGESRAAFSFCLCAKCAPNYGALFPLSLLQSVESYDVLPTVRKH